jgi:hypothetical protein
VAVMMDDVFSVFSKMVCMYLDLTRRLWRRVAKRGWCRKIRKVSKLFFLLSFVLLAILHVQTGQIILMHVMTKNCRVF